MFKKDNNNKSFKPAGPLKAFLFWPMYLGILLAIITICIYIIDVTAGFIMFIFMICYVLLCLFFLLYFKRSIMHDMIEFSSNYSQVQHKLLFELSVPYCLLDNNGNVMWVNRQMQEIIQKREYKKNIALILPEITRNILPQDEKTVETHLSYQEKEYRIELKKICAEELMQNVGIVANKSEDSFIVMYMFDETEIKNYIRKLKAERFVVGLVYIDNYEEALESIDDVRKSLFIGLVDKKVNKYFSAGAAIVRKLEKDKYLVVFRYQYLEKLMANRFSLLEDIKQVNIGNEMTITLSIGIGTGAQDYSKNFEVARAAMDLALGRGGDQAVIRDGDRILYYGGKSQQMEKNTRVKVRVKAHALKQLLEANERVLIMGHKLGDIDSFGSALGMYVICRRLKTDAHIVINDVTSSVRPFKNKFAGKEEYPDDLFLNNEQAMEYMTPTTVLIVVDVNRPKLTECPELLQKCKNLMVFDHHRQSSDSISGAVLSYIDPYASSASEIITEMIQYVDDSVKLKSAEADALYAGILIDTDGFNSKAGPRTFEAAAFLRRHGADVTRVRKMLRNNMEEYKAIAEAVSKAEVYENAFAITIFNGDGLDSPTIGGAKAANQLLDISGIKASFVITSYNNQVYISARSIDEVNVQLVMEQLGGGGHMSIAGAQLKDCTPEQAVQTIRVTIDKMLKEGEI